MSKGEWIEHFVVTFLATWAATEYNDACSHGQQERLSNPPVEDAYFLAGKAFERAFPDFGKAPRR